MHAAGSGLGCYDSCRVRRVWASCVVSSSVSQSIINQSKRSSRRKPHTGKGKEKTHLSAATTKVSAQPVHHAVTTVAGSSVQHVRWRRRAPCAMCRVCCRAPCSQRQMVYKYVFIYLYIYIDKADTSRTRIAHTAAQG